MGNLTNDTPPKRGFWTPPSYGTFSTPVRCQCSVFPVQKSTTEQTRSSFGGVQKFSGERVLWYVFLPPYVLHPPISRPKKESGINSGTPFFKEFCRAFASERGVLEHHLRFGLPEPLLISVGRREKTPTPKISFQPF